MNSQQKAEEFLDKAGIIDHNITSSLEEWDGLHLSELLGMFAEQHAQHVAGGEIQPKENCIKDCGNTVINGTTDRICLSCGSSIVPLSTSPKYLTDEEIEEYLLNKYGNLCVGTEADQQVFFIRVGMKAARDLIEGKEG